MTEESFEGGAESDRFLNYKVGCEDEKLWEERRLHYERRGTPVECLRRGYGQGTRHIDTYIPTQDKTLLEETPNRVIQRVVEVTGTNVDAGFPLPTDAEQQSIFARHGYRS